MARIQENLPGMLWHEQLDPENFAFLENQYNNTRDYEEIFKCFWGIEEVHKILTVNLSPSCKSDAEADKLRNKGNDAYKLKCLREALNLYNRSIMAAPHPILQSVPAPNETNDDEDCLRRWIDPAKYGGVAQGESKALAMGYANRSAVMFEINAYDECLRDIKLAFEYGYPEESTNKLETRRERCLAAKDKASELAKSPKKKSEVDPTDGASRLSDDFGKIQMSPPKSPAKLDNPLPLKDLLKTPENKPPKIVEANESMQCLSSSVKVTFVPGRGRSLIATRNIVTGEVLGVERAYSAAINLAELAMHCSTCLKRCLTPLPCPGCTKVIFCTDECRIKGLAEEHWIECRILATMDAMELFNKTLIFKMLKNANFSKVRSVIQRVKAVNHDEPEYNGCNENKKYVTDSYHAINHLCSNMEQQGFKMLFSQCQIAYVITKLLELSDRFFVDDADETFTPTREDLVATGGVLLSHAIKLNYNPYEVLDLQLKKAVAACVFPTLSLINHSCNPSAKHYNFNRYIVLRSMRPIKAGDEITDTYTKDFSEEPTESRKKFLKSYFIECNCEPCQNMWPLYAELPTLVFCCHRCKQPVAGTNPMCPACQTKASPTRATPQAVREQQERAQMVWNAIYNALKAGMKMGNKNSITNIDFKLICDTIDLLQKHVVLPCQTMCDLQNILLKGFELGK